MSDVSEILPSELHPADFQRAVYAHIVPPTMDWKRATEPAYWQSVAQKLRPGDRIEVATADRQICFEGYIVEVNHRLSPPHLLVSWRAVHPLDLPLPAPPKRSGARFMVRAEMGSARHFEIYDAELGAVARAHLSRDEALDAAAAMELQARDALDHAAAPPRRAVGAR